VEKKGDFVMVRPTQHPKNDLHYLVFGKKTLSRTFKEPSAEFMALLEHYNIKSDGFFGLNKSLRYSEGIIEVGEQIRVAGIAHWKTLKEPRRGFVV
jgi:hypothetical protein